MEGGIAQHGEHAGIEADRLVLGLVRAPAELHGQLDAAAFELAFVDQAQAGGEEGHEGGPETVGHAEGGSGAGLVVVLDEARPAVAEGRIRKEVRAHARRVAVQQAVVEHLVVGEVEALLLEVHSRSQ